MKSQRRRKNKNTSTLTTYFNCNHPGFKYKLQELREVGYINLWIL